MKKKSTAKIKCKDFSDDEFGFVRVPSIRNVAFRKNKKSKSKSRKRRVKTEKHLS